MHKLKRVAQAVMYPSRRFGAKQTGRSRSRQSKAKAKSSNLSRQTPSQTPKRRRSGRQMPNKSAAETFGGLAEETLEGQCSRLFNLR
jgi:hypothetical protein